MPIKKTTVKSKFNFKKSILLIILGILLVTFFGYLVNPVSAQKHLASNSEEVFESFSKEFDREPTGEELMRLRKELEESYKVVEEQFILGNYTYAEWELRRIIALLVDPSFPQLEGDVEIETWELKNSASSNVIRSQVDRRTRGTPLICRLLPFHPSCNSPRPQTRNQQTQDLEEEVRSEIERIVVDPFSGALGDEGSRTQLRMASEEFYRLAIDSLNLLQEILVTNYFDGVNNNREEIKNEALIVAELKRQYENIRLTALLRTRNQDPRTSNIERLDIESIKAISVNHQSVIVYYSIASSDNLHIWVIDTQGNIDLEKKSPDSKSNIISEWAESARKAAASYVERGDSGIGYEVWKRGLRTSFADDEVERLIINQSEQNSALSSLYKLLIEPIENHLPRSQLGTNVIFVPYGSLFNVPFSVLKDGNDQYFLEKYAIRVAPNLRVLKFGGSVMEEISQGGENLFVGNPLMPTITFNRDGSSQELRELDGAQTEARVLADLFAVFPLVRHLASETLIRTKMRPARIIHLATHGLLDDTDLDVDVAEIIEDRSRLEGQPQGNGSDSVRNLLRGAVALAPNSRDDGLLTATEILDMDLNAELVVMSACNTGRGIPSESTILGLPYAFGAAGASRVIVSLWSVPDKPTQLLMELFYKDMKNQAATHMEIEPAKALRHAMLEIKQQEQYKDPVNWAGFTLIEVDQDN
jgi:CHAT domain-containing protein